MKLDPCVYLRAAQRIDGGRFARGIFHRRYCCPAILVAASTRNRFGTTVREPPTKRGLTYQHEFRRLFRPDKVAIVWFGFPWNSRNQDARVLALCFMAAIAATENFPE